MDTIIRLNHIYAEYDGKQVLNDICLEVCDHDYMGIIGPNGGGKTTLIKIILGLKQPSSGTVEFFRKGQRVKELSIGYLPQYNEIDKKFPISVYEVVLSGLSRQKRLFHPFTSQQHAQVEETLRQMELEDFKHRHIGSLSGGQLQRVLLARAIVAHPDVVVLDEPNTYIDKRFQAQMYEMLNKVNQDCAIIIVSHDIAEILNNVKHVACVNHLLHYHDHTNIPMAQLERHFLEM